MEQAVIFGLAVAWADHANINIDHLISGNASGRKKPISYWFFLLSSWADSEWQILLILHDSLDEAVGRVCKSW